MGDTSYCGPARRDNQVYSIYGLQLLPPTRWMLCFPFNLGHSDHRQASNLQMHCTLLPQELALQMAALAAEACKKDNHKAAEAGTNEDDMAGKRRGKGSKQGAVASQGLRKGGEENKPAVACLGHASRRQGKVGVVGARTMALMHHSAPPPRATK
jgi:hypothetical protein